MPERVGARKVLTPDVQGPDSWVIVRPATVGEILEVQRAQAQRTGFWYRLGVFLGRLVGALGLRKWQSTADVTQEFAYRMMRFIREWNWVDEHGQPLPQPVDDPSVVEQLTEAELVAIVDAVYGRSQSEEQKN